MERPLIMATGFKQWLLFIESIEENFDDWLESIKSYAKPNESELKSFEVTPEQKNHIIAALKRARKENQDYLKLLLGVASQSTHAMEEDYDAAINIITQLLAEKDKDNQPLLTKQQIAAKGWFNTGKETLTTLNDQLNTHLQSKIGKRQELLAKKRGLGDEVEPIYNEDGITIYHLPPLKNLSQEELKKRHKIYCKYGVGTKWCTAQPSWDAFKSYVDKDIYILHKNGQPMYQWVDYASPKAKQFMNIYNAKPIFIGDDIQKAIDKAGITHTMKDYNVPVVISKKEFEAMPLENKIEYITNLTKFSDERPYKIKKSNYYGLYDLFYDPNNKETQEAFIKSDKENALLIKSFEKSDMQMVEKILSSLDSKLDVFMALFEAHGDGALNSFMKSISPETYQKLWDIANQILKEDPKKESVQALKFFTGDGPFIRDILKNDRLDLLQIYLNNTKLTHSFLTHLKDYIYQTASSRELGKFKKLFLILKNNNLLKAKIQDGKTMLDYLTESAMRTGCGPCLEFLKTQVPDPEHWKKTMLPFVAQLKTVPFVSHWEDVFTKIIGEMSPQEFDDFVKNELPKVDYYGNQFEYIPPDMMWLYSGSMNKKALHQAVSRLISNDSRRLYDNDVDYFRSIMYSPHPYINSTNVPFINPSFDINDPKWTEEIGNTINKDLDSYIDVTKEMTEKYKNSPYSKKFRDLLADLLFNISYKTADNTQLDDLLNGHFFSTLYHKHTDNYFYEKENLLRSVQYDDPSKEKVFDKVKDKLVELQKVLSKSIYDIAKAERQTP